MRKELIGHVGVDSGGLLITDPCYLRGWKDKGKEDQTPYKIDISTKQIYACRFHFDKENGDPDTILFDTYESPLPNGKTPNQMIKEGQWEEVRCNPGLHEYSYNGYTNATCGSKHSGSMVFQLGHEGAGVVFSSGYGDGFYPVYAEYNKENRIMRVTIEMGSEEDENT
jgi:hypothetical protein